MLKSLTFALSLVFAICHTLPAQFDAATVLGTVKDSSGAVVSGAKVKLENVRTGVTTTSLSNEAGNFDFIGVPHRRLPPVG